MGSFDKEKFDSSFNIKKSELEKVQSGEVRALIEKYKSSNTIGSSEFYDRRIEMKKKHFKDIIELAIYSFVDSIPFKIKIDDNDKNAFEEILKEITSGHLEYEKSSLKAAMVSYGNTIDSVIVTESVKAYEKQLTAVKFSTMALLPERIADHNNMKFAGVPGVELASAWKKYSILIIIGIITVALCVTVLYFIL